MLDYTFSQMTFLFIAYSFIGWVCESVIATIISKRFVNRGFLFGPYIPMYGFWGLITLSFSKIADEMFVLVFIISGIAAVLIRALIIIIFKIIFDSKWIEIKREKIKILKSSVFIFFIFGTLGYLTVYLLDPYFSRMIDWFYPESLQVLCTVILGIIILDMILSIASLIDIRNRLIKLMDARPEIERINEKYHCFDSDSYAIEGLEKYNNQHPENQEVSEAFHHLEKILDFKNGESRLLSSFPQMVPFEISKQYVVFNEFHFNSVNEIKNHLSDAVLNKSGKKWEYDVTFTKLIWIFLIGCVVGYIIETMYCLLHNGYFESRQGLIYGPFSQVYGLGAVILTIFLEPLAKRKTIWLFIFSAILGGLFEAGASYVQELAFGTYSWNYSKNAMSMFGGRTSGEYMLLWGFLGTAYMRVVYPKISDIIGRIPKISRRILTGIVAVLLFVDILISGFAVDRWSDRHNDIPPSNSFEEFVDEHYNDGYMKKVYPHMKIS